MSPVRAAAASAPIGEARAASARVVGGRIGAWPRTTGPEAASDDALGADAPGLGLGAGWLVLRNCALGGGGPRVGLALLHPSVGVALVDFAPGETDAAGRLRRSLDARRFPAIFGGYPPVVRVVLAGGRPTDLGAALAAEFRARPPLALAGGDAWVGTARAAIEAEQPARPAPERRPARRRRRSRPWRPAAVAATAGASVAAALALVSAPPPGRVAGTAARPAVTAHHEEGGAAPVLPSGTASPGGDDPGTQDVAAALLSADIGAAAAARTAGGAAEPTPGAAVDGDRHGPALAPLADGDAADRPRGARTEPASAVAGRPAEGVVDSTSTRARAASARPAPVAPQPTHGGRRAAPAAAAAAPVPDAGGEGRCREILMRATAGGDLSDGDKELLRRGCRQRD